MMRHRLQGAVQMKTRGMVARTVLGLLAIALVAARPAAAAQLTWSYSGQVTFTDVPVSFPLGSPVHLVVIVDPDAQTLVSATVTVNGVDYQVAGPRVVANLGFINGHYAHYASGPATGATVGGFVPWFGTFFFSADYA